MWAGHPREEAMFQATVEWVRLVIEGASRWVAVGVSDAALDFW